MPYSYAGDNKDYKTPRPKPPTTSVGVGEHLCAECGTAVDDFTWLIHQTCHKAPMLYGPGLHTVPYAAMPELGRIIETFGVDLLQWIQRQTKIHEHGCITGDCSHESQVDCWNSLVRDCAADLRAFGKGASNAL